MAGLDELRMNLGSGLYGDLLEAQQAPGGQFDAAPMPSAGAMPEEEPGFWENLSNTASTIFTGSPDPRLSVADEAKARNKALMQGGLYTILAAGKTDNAIEALAQGALQGQQVGAQERAALGGPDALIEEAIRSGDPNMIQAATNLLTPQVQKVEGGSLVSRPGEPPRFIPAEPPVPELRQGADGKWYAIDPSSGIGQEIKGPPGSGNEEGLPGLGDEPDWQLGTDAVGRKVMYDLNHPGEKVTYDPDYPYVFHNGKAFFIGDGAPQQVGYPSEEDPVERASFMMSANANYTSETTDFQDRAAELVNILALTDVDQHTGQGNAGLLNSVVRYMDPGSTSRSSEVDVVKKAQSLMQRIESWVVSNVDEDAPFLTVKSLANIRKMSLAVAKAQANIMDANVNKKWADILAPVGAEGLIGNPLRNAVAQYGEPEMTMEEVIRYLEGDFFDEVKADAAAAGFGGADGEASIDDIRGRIGG